MNTTCVLQLKNRPRSGQTAQLWRACLVRSRTWVWSDTHRENAGVVAHTCNPCAGGEQDPSAHYPDNVALVGQLRDTQHLQGNIKTSSFIQVSDLSFTFPLKSNILFFLLYPRASPLYPLLTGGIFTSGSRHPNSICKWAQPKFIDPHEISMTNLENIRIPLLYLHSIHVLIYYLSKHII